MENPRRQLILQYVERSPGVRFFELKRELDLPHGVLVHHLRILRDQGLLIWDRTGRRLAFRLPGQRAPVFEDADAAQMLDLVGRRPGLSVKDAAGELGWTRRKATYWIDRLSRAGRIRRIPEGSQTRLSVVHLDSTMRVAPPAGA